jgi:hypothetical protein
MVEGDPVGAGSEVERSRRAGRRVAAELVRWSIESEAQSVHSGQPRLHAHEMVRAARDYLSDSLAAGDAEPRE